MQYDMVRFHFSLLLAAVATNDIFVALTDAQEQEPIMVVTTPFGGEVAGLSSDGVESFLGIQYAQVGQRFSRSSTLLDPDRLGYASAFGPNNCPQLYLGLHDFLHQPRQEEEECLYLNIWWRPRNATESTPLTTMLWIH
jgi:carboxylesterase type B